MIALVESPRISGSEAAKDLFRRVLDTMERRDFSVRFWDGEVLPPLNGAPGKFTLVLCAPQAVRQMLEKPGSLAFGEAYAHGLFEIEGPLLAALSEADSLIEVPLTRLEKLGIAWRCKTLPKFRAGNGLFAGVELNGARESRLRRELAVKYHYDQPIEFWRAWLDENLVYSCACFQDPEQPLASAQRAKLEMVCRKLRLRPGMRFLDMGCGWGALLCHAARHYGVQAIGITLSPRQADQARERVVALGLQDRCEVRVGDFRDFTDARGFDAIASIGAVEHIVEKEFPEYFEHAFSLLKPKGCFLSHGIARADHARVGGDSFIDRYVFPDYWLATIGKTVATAEAAGFEVRDVENLRDHYALTAAHWSRRFEAAREEIEQIADPLTFRVFRLYLAGVEFDFRGGRLNLGQTLLVKPENGEAGLPLTRADWYARPPA